MQLILELIDLRSFSNLWYWIGLAVLWSSAAHWVLGVPWDMVLRARRLGGRTGEDLVEMTRINVVRLLGIWREAGTALVMFASFLATTLLLLGFGYGAEFAQALGLLVLPLCGVWALALRTARAIEAEWEAGVPLPERVAEILARHRRRVQGLGMLSIIVTAFWGMFQNISYSVLG